MRRRASLSPPRPTTRDVYLFRSVSHGVYNLSVKAPGFKDQASGTELKSMSLRTSAQIRHASSGTLETVNVFHGRPSAGHAGCDHRAGVDRKFINDLPLNGKKCLGSGISHPWSHGGRWRMQWGARQTTSSRTAHPERHHADILMDGGDHTIELRTAEQRAFRVDSPTPPSSRCRVNDFKLQETNFSAPNTGFHSGRHPFIKYGSHARHQTAFTAACLRVMFRVHLHHRWTQITWLDTTMEFPRYPCGANDFGGTIGGPIWKNKMFFFFDYQGTPITPVGRAEPSMVCPAIN